MKEENPNIEELLNSFIDGELTERHRTEVERLISHDARAAQRLRELQKCKMLVSSLPRAEAPAEMLERIRASLERETVPDQQPERFNERRGARHLLARRVLTAAAMIGLTAVLGAVIYTIVVPESGPGMPIAVEDSRPVDRVESAFYGRLELKTSNLVAVDASINRAIEENGLSDYTSERRQGDKGVYTLSCSRESLRLLLGDLESIWERFDSATLFVETNQFGEQVVVDTVTAEQIGAIVNQGTLTKRIELAEDFAALKDMAGLLPGRNILAAIDDTGSDLITIPKPRLTRPIKATKAPAPQVKDEEMVHLTIVLAGSE